MYIGYSVHVYVHRPQTHYTAVVSFQSEPWYICCVCALPCVQISGSSGEEVEVVEFRSMWETLPMALPPHSYIRHVYTQALSVYCPHRYWWSVVSHFHHTAEGSALQCFSLLTVSLSSSAVIVCNT